jgi:hypothetical protein
MSPRPLRRKPKAELLKAVRPRCAPSLTGGRYRVPNASSRFEASTVAISYRVDCRLPNVEAWL